jgi:8-oxo-dGTP pyrophosphatase MutT (NUDIX family)
LRLKLNPKLFLRFARLKRAMTLGVRAVVLDDNSRVFLIKHTYVDGWHFPGGGVEVGETMLDAAKRELEEEGGIVLESAPELFGIYLMRHQSNRDHVAVYVCRKWSQPRPPHVPNFEIADCRFFPLDALPEGTTDGTRRRLAEITRGVPVSTDW